MTTGECFSYNYAPGSLASVRLITFDIGGTLLFPNPSVGEVCSKVLARHGHECPPEEIEANFLRVWNRLALVPLDVINEATERDRWRDVLNGAFAELAGQVDMDNLFDDLWEAFAVPQSWRWPKETDETMIELRRRGYHLAVLSNWDGRLRPLLQRAGLASLFDEMFISCEVGAEKPDPRIFAIVENRFGFRGQEILHIGDSIHHDVAGARAAGWHVLHLSGSYGSGRIASIKEILAHLPSGSDFA